MNRKKVVFDALRHQTTELIPYYAEFTIGEKDKLTRWFGDERFEERFTRFMQSGAYGWFEDMPGKPGYVRDEFGVVWNRSGADKDIGVIEQAVIPDICDCRYQMPDPDEARFREVLRELAAHKDVFTVADVGFMMFERAWTLLTMPETLIAMIAAPAELGELLDRICEFDLKVIDIALEYDIDCIHFGDDWGQQKGLIMGAPHWRRFIKPRLKRLYERVKSRGRFVSQHSCGDIHEVFPDLIEIGLDVYQTFQPEIYDIEHVKKEYGRDLCFWGGISTQRLLPYATPEEVRRETARIMRVMGSGGGYIAAPTHAVPADVPAENIAAMLDVFENQKKYLGGIG